MTWDAYATKDWRPYTATTEPGPPGHAGAALSEGFCPDCRVHLGDRDDPRVSATSCTRCRLAWRRWPDGRVVGERGGSRVWLDHTSPPVPTTQVTVTHYPDGIRQEAVIHGAEG